MLWNAQNVTHEQADGCMLQPTIGFRGLKTGFPSRIQQHALDIQFCSVLNCLFCLLSSEYCACYLLDFFSLIQWCNFLLSDDTIECCKSTTAVTDFVDYLSFHLRWQTKSWSYEQSTSGSGQRTKRRCVAYLYDATTMKNMRCVGIHISQLGVISTLNFVSDIWILFMM